MSAFIYSSVRCTLKSLLAAESQHSAEACRIDFAPRAGGDRLAFWCALLLPVLFLFGMTAKGQTAATLTSPTPGSALPGSSATFDWTAGSGVSAYRLTLGTAGAGSSNLYSSGSLSTTSAAVSGLPVGALTWGTMDAWLQCKAPASGSAVTAPVLASCTVGKGGGFELSASSLSAMGVAASRGAVGASVTVAGTTYANGAATQSLSFNHQYGQQTFSFDLPYGSNAKTLNLNGYLTFGPASSGSTDHSYDYIVAQDNNGGHALVLQLHTGTFKGCAYCVFVEANPNWTVNDSAAGIPVTAGTRYAFSAQASESTGVASVALYNASTFAQVGKTITVTSATGGTIAHLTAGDMLSATASGSTSYFEDLMLDWSGHQGFPNVPHAQTIYATLSSQISGAWQAKSYTYTEAAAQATADLSAISCATASYIGAGSDACTVTLNAAAPSAGLTVTLASNDSAVTVPASVTVAAGATSAAFTANVAQVSTSQTATLTASANSVSKTATVQLTAATPALTLSAASLAFGSVNVNAAASQTVTLSSTGNVPVTVNSAAVSGAGYSVSGATLPVTLSVGQTATLTVQFDPTAAGTAAGALTVTSNSANGTLSAVSLSGTGIAVLSSLSCGTASFTGAGSDACTATLNAAAPAGGVSVSLASNNSAMTVPATVTVAAGSINAAFTATAASVTTAQTVTLTASEGGASATASIKLNAAVSTLTVSAASVAFGSVAMNSSATQTVTVSSTGTAAVTVNSAIVTGAGFSIVGAAFPATLNPGQAATLTLQFAPSATGTAAGTLTIASNSSTGATAVVNLSGSAAAAPAVLTAPAPGSTLAGTSAAFSWTAGTGVAAYQLTLGTTGANSSDLYSSGSTTATTVNVSGLPTGSANWGTMDAVLSCSGQAAGTAVTSTVLQACTAGDGSGGFDLSESPLTPMQIAASQGGLGASVTTGETSFPASTATQSMSFDHQYSQQYFSFDIPGGANAGTLNMNGYITFGPAASGATDAAFDYITAGDTNGGHAFVIQLHTGTFNGCTYCVFLETNPNWTPTNSANGIAITPGTRYAFSVQGNETTGVASLALYDASTFKQVGATITDVASTGGYIAHVMIGNFQSATATGISYFEDLMLDWSGHQAFPNVPAPATIYATLSSQIGGVWQASNYTFTAAAATQPAQPVLSSISCSSASMSGSGSDNCTVSLTGNATGSGVSVSLASNNAAVSVPTTVMVPANANSATFAAAIAAVSTSQTATVTASAGTASQNFAVQLNPVLTATPVLSVSANSLSFGSVPVNTAATEAVTLTSTGMAPVTINSASLTGAGFTASGAILPVTLSAGQSVTVEVTFDPAAAGATSGTLTIASNSSTGASTTLNLSGTGTNATYQVSLSWDAADSTEDPIAGYNIYRAVSGSTLYQRLNASVASSTTFVDTSVQTGTAYEYYIESVDMAGVSSAPSSTIALAVP